MAQVELQAVPTGRKQDLIDATMRAICDHGLSNVTLAKVATLAGCTAAASQPQISFAPLMPKFRQRRSICGVGEPSGLPSHPSIG